MLRITFRMYSSSKSSWKQEHAGDITLHLTYVVVLVQTITRVVFTGQHSDLLFFVRGEDMRDNLTAIYKINSQINKP